MMVTVAVMRKVMAIAGLVTLVFVKQTSGLYLVSLYKITFNNQ